MDYFAGLDVSVKETSVCVVDDTGRIVQEVKVASEPEALLAVLTKRAYHFKRIRLEAGPLSQWLFNGLAEAGLPVICVETQHAWLQESHDWPGLAAIGKITASREIDGKTSLETRCYLLSNSFTPERFNAIVRSHWGIENGLHWVFEVVMDEDQARNRKDHGPQNLALLRRLALNLAKLEPSKGSMRGKLKQAGWDNAFLAQILLQFTNIQMR